jgi:hypothetical protein
MSSAIYDFLNSELKLFRSNCIVITVSDNARPLSWFEHNIQGRPSLKCSSISRSAPTSASNKKDHRWGETSSLDRQWDFSSGHHRHSSRPAVADSANATDNVSKNELQHLSPAQRDKSCSTMDLKQRLTLSDQAILKETFHVHEQDVSAARKTTPPLRMMYHDRHQSTSMPSLRTLPSYENLRSKKPPKYVCDKPADNAVNKFKQLGHRAAIESKKKKGGQESPQQPQRQKSISLPENMFVHIFKDLERH